MIEPASSRTRVRILRGNWRWAGGFRCALLLGSMWLAPSWAAAETSGCADVCALYSDLLMAPERTLIGSIRTVERVAKPSMGLRNTRGRWVQREVYLGSEAFETTFYMGSGLIQRIELVSTASDVECRQRTPWANAIAALGAWQDKSAVTGQIETGNNIQYSSHWAAGDVDVNVYLSVTVEACSTRVSFTKRIVKDASDL